jgi:hypothetical protein
MPSLNNGAFKDGQTFYTPAPGCDDKIRWKMLEADIKNAFASPEYLREVYKKFPDVESVIEYYRNYKRGILDTMRNWPKIVPPKVKKILAKYWIE